MSKLDNVAEDLEFNLQISVGGFTDLVPLSGKVLDFGCGYGRITNQLHTFGYGEVIGIDSSNKMIERGLKLFPSLNLIHHKSNILPFADNTFDATLTCAVFTCIQSESTRKNISSELYRVLKPNGVIYLAEFCSNKSNTFISGFGVPMWYGTPYELENLLMHFNIEYSLIKNCKTISGQTTKACHIFARKII